MKPTLRLLGAVSLALALTHTAGCTGAEQRKAHYIEKGEQYFAAANYEKARVEFSNALQIDPKDATAQYDAGRTAEKLGDPRQSVGHYQAAIDSDPAHHAARAALARLFLVGGAIDRVLPLVEEGLKQDPKNPQLLTVRGAARAQRQDVPGAFEDAEAAVAGAPGDEYAIALLASLYRQNARSDKAIEVIQSGLQHVPASTDLRVILAELELEHERPDVAEAQLRKVVELKPKELPHRYRLARFYLMRKDIDRAETTLREAIAMAPDDVSAKIALVQMMQSNRSFEQAEQQWRQFIQSDADNGELKLAFARFYESSGKRDKAEVEYRDLIRRFDTKPEALMARNRLAALLVQKQQVEPAAKLIEEVLKENPRDNDALLLRGNLALARGDTAAAIADLRAVLRDRPTATNIKRALARAHLQNHETPLAEELLRSAVQENPGDTGTRMDLAQLLVRGGKAEEARPILEQIVKETPGDVAALEQLFRVQAQLRDLQAAELTANEIVRAHPEIPLGHYLQGVVAESHKEPDKAAVAYERALEIKPDAAEPLAALVRLDLARKQPERALARLNDVIAKQPDNVIALNLKGEILTSRGDLQSATAVFESAIAKASQWWSPYRGLAVAHLAAKNSDAALATLERGVKATKGAAALATDLAALYERQGRTDDAIRTYDELVKREPQSITAANNLAMLLVSYRDDRASLDRAYELSTKLQNETNPAFLNTRGWVKYKRGEFADAVSLLQQAVEKVPESPLMRYHLGMAQLRAGDKGEAMKNLAAAVASGREFHGHQEARATLEQLTQAG
ncbi:MAG TPA: tetratricopeptide repeat protein [Steroidobacteraceae bacterium]|nr:tetratricopeptide repeat protein [Steroidobacteraceae bacterium]